MRAVVQRVTFARVRVGDRSVGEIGRGLLVFAGVEKGDGPDDIAYIAGKVNDLRIFEDAAGKMNRSLAEAGGAVLAVSQFTLDRKSTSLNSSHRSNSYAGFCFAI